MGILDAWRAKRGHRRNNVNCEEDHLGGYIRSSPRPAPSGLAVEHGDPETWNPRLWRWAVDRFGVQSALDVGCGEGHAARYLRELGVEVLGVDGSKLARRDSRIPDAHVLHDFTTGPYVPNRPFDLAWSCEFVEHVEDRYADNFLTCFEAAEIVMMTYAAPGQPGWHHVNCRPASYWAWRLLERGFAFDDALTAESRELAEGRHYRERGLLFRRR